MNLETLTTNTIHHYESSPQAFWEGTKDHDVSQNIDAFFRNLPKISSVVLDFGCGPGRDIKSLTKRGLKTIGLDGCPDFCQMAREYSKQDVWQQNFIHLDLPKNHFAGIFANASLFHIPRESLLQTLKHFHQSLIPNGIVFCSNPRGSMIEQVNGLRYGNYMDTEGWSTFFQEAGFQEVEHYYRPPGRPREEQPWLAMVWRKI